MDLKPCLDPLDKLPSPYHSYTSVEDVVERDKDVVESVLKDKMVGTGEKSHGEWYVKYKGDDTPEWQPASAFMLDVTDAWADYNKQHDIDVTLRDIRPDVFLRLLCSCPKSPFPTSPSGLVHKRPHLKTLL